jgi:hypothetical protein
MWLYCNKTLCVKVVLFVKLAIVLFAEWYCHYFACELRTNKSESGVEFFGQSVEPFVCKFQNALKIRKRKKFD